MSGRSDYLLRAISEEDLEMVLAWRNSDRVRASSYSDHVITPDEHMAWFDRLQNNSTNVFMIFEIRETPFGVVQINRIDKVNGTGHWGFYIGVEEAPRGTGSIMGLLGVEFAFIELGLRKIVGESFAFNQASIRFHLKLGFVEEGRLRKHVLKGEKYEDIVVFGLLRSDWERNRMELEGSVFGSQGR